LVEILDLRNREDLPTLVVMTERDPEREQSDGAPGESEKPAHNGPQEIEDAARQEGEYPADETNEG
jgi:hypothetical protein